MDKFKWLIEEEAYLVQNYNRVSHSDLAEFLNRTKKAVRVKYGKLKLSPHFPQLMEMEVNDFFSDPSKFPVRDISKSIHKWKRDEEIFLWQCLQKGMKFPEVAKKLHVSRKAACVKYQKLRKKYEAGDLDNEWNLEKSVSVHENKKSSIGEKILVDDLLLPFPIRELCREKDYATFGELIKDDKVLKSRYGDYLRTYIETIIKEYGINRLPVYRRDLYSDSLSKAIFNALEHSQAPLRNQEMFYKYYSSGNWNLERLGEEYSLTRERIRQIIESVRQRYLPESYLGDMVEQRLERLRISRMRPIIISELPVIDPWFDIISDKRSYASFAKFIKLVTGNRWRSFKSSKGALLSRCSAPNIKTIISETIDEILRLGISMDIRMLKVVINKRLARFNASELEYLILKEILNKLWIETDSTGEIRIYGVKRGIISGIEACLRKTGKPMHFKDIARVLSSFISKPLSSQVINSLLQHSETAFLAGRGIYSLEENHPEIVLLKPIVTEQVENIVRKSKDRQWHTNELIRILANRMKIPPIVNKYSLNYMISQSSKLTYLGRNAWISKASSSSDKIERIPQDQAIALVLEEAGRPLKVEEVRERVAEKRGIRDNFQVFKRLPFIQKERGLWCLLELEYNINEEDLKYIYQYIDKLLQDRPYITAENLDPLHKLLKYCTLDDNVLRQIIKDRKDYVLEKLRTAGLS